MTKMLKVILIATFSMEAWHGTIVASAGCWLESFLKYSMFNRDSDSPFMD